HVYIDSQGGERTFIHTVNAAIDLLSNRNVTVKEIIATDFSRDKLINKVRFVTKDYAITDLGAGMKAFLRYGKAEELLSYLDKKGLGESANEKRMIDIIRGIGESLQIADPAGLNEYLGELQNNPELLSPESYSDTNFRIIVEDIKREYDRLLAPDGNLTDIIEWLYKKGFTVQALTFIEDKIPDYIFHEMKCISVKHSYATEVDAVNENGWSGGYETRIANAVVKNASGRLVQEGKKEYLSAVKNLILNRCISENWNRQEKRTKYISEWTELIKTQDRIKPYIKYVPLKELFDAYNSYRKLGTTYYMACQHGRMKQYEKIEEIMALPEKVLSTGTGNIHAFYKSLLFEKDEDLRKDDENLYSVYLKKIRTYLCGDSFLLDDKNKEIVVDLICSHIYRPELEKIYNNNVEKSKIDSAYEHMVLLESEDDNKIQMVVDSSERDYCMLMEALIEKYCFYCNHKTTVVKDYTFDNDLHARQSELFAKLLNEDLDDEDLYKNYIEYRNITYMIEYRREKTKQTEVFDNVEFYFRQIGGEMEELYHEKSYLICEDGYLYQTIAGLKESTSLPTIKLEEICIRKDVDKRLLEKILLLHGAISKERNNTNHASEKSVRLPLCVLERVIKLYLNWIRTL
ncbi:MAG: hypothetical protein IJ336_06675, partial [Lachnospiraceae bacterium]|nr:hypothetical protein [Lachnospiraceae bacterium]